MMTLSSLFTRVEPVLSIDYQPGTQSNVEQNTEVPRASFSRLESLAMSNRPPSRRPARQPRPRAPRPEAPPISAPPPKGVKWKAKANKRKRDEVAGAMGENRMKTRPSEDDGRGKEYDPKLDKRIKPFYCLICNKNYKHNYELGQHMRQVHRKYNTTFKRYTLKPARTIKPLEVERQRKAGDKFKVKKLKRGPETEISNKNDNKNSKNRTECTLCAKSYKSKAKLRNHYKDNHPSFFSSFSFTQ